jgi:hypothetical protein
VLGECDIVDAVDIELCLEESALFLPIF